MNVIMSLTPYGLGLKVGGQAAERTQRRMNAINRASKAVTVARGRFRQSIIGALEYESKLTDSTVV